jgi:glycosyltransferase involved in cell wall biosynthesis
MSESGRNALRARAAARAKERYDWEAVTTEYENLLTGMTRLRR